MLATLVREPFDKKGWVYEEKYDGYRIIAYKAGEGVQLFSRNAIDRTDVLSGLRAITTLLATPPAALAG